MARWVVLCLMLNACGWASAYRRDMAHTGHADADIERCEKSIKDCGVIASSLLASSTPADGMGLARDMCNADPAECWLMFAYFGVLHRFDEADAAMKRLCKGDDDCIASHAASVATSGISDEVREHNYQHLARRHALAKLSCEKSPTKCHFASEAIRVASLTGPTAAERLAMIEPYCTDLVSKVCVEKMRLQTQIGPRTAELEALCKSIPSKQGHAVLQKMNELCGDCLYVCPKETHLRLEKYRTLLAEARGPCTATEIFETVDERSLGERIVADARRTDCKTRPLRPDEKTVNSRADSVRECPSQPGAQRKLVGYVDGEDCKRVAAAQKALSDLSY